MRKIREAGSALLMAVVAVSLIGAAVLLAANHLGDRAMDLRIELRDLTLRALSDAAVAESLARLDADPDWRGFELRRLSGGTIASSVSPSGEGTVTVVATATVSSWRAVVVANVELSQAGPRVLTWRRHTGPAHA